MASLLANLFTKAGEIQAAVELLDETIRALGPEQSELALGLENDLIHVARLLPSTAALARSRTDALRSRQDPLTHGSMTPAQRKTMVNVAVEMTRAGDSAEQAALLADQAFGEGRMLAEAPAELAPFTATMFVLLYADRFQPARDMLRMGLEDARRRGSAPAFTVVSFGSALVAYRQGDLGEVEDHLAASEGLEAMPPFLAPWVAALNVEVLLDKGDTEGAEGLLRRRELMAEVPGVYIYNALLVARGRLRFARGDLPGALDDLVLAGRRQVDSGETNPAILAWRSRSALVHAALGRRDEACRLAAEEIALAARFGAPRALGVALRVSGLVTAGNDGIDQLSAAVSTLEGSDANLELARALIDLGAALRRAGRRSDARQPLRRGMDLAVRCGATGLVERARDELAATGARPRRLLLSGVDALTPTERRVATMAATGLTNPQIAQALFVSARTIEMHLTGAYRKLEITSRTELAPALQATGTIDRPPP